MVSHWSGLKRQGPLYIWTVSLLLWLHRILTLLWRTFSLSLMGYICVALQRLLWFPFMDIWCFKLLGIVFVVNQTQFFSHVTCTFVSQYLGFYEFGQKFFILTQPSLSGEDVHVFLFLLLETTFQTHQNSLTRHSERLWECSKHHLQYNWILIKISWNLSQKKYKKVFSEKKVWIKYKKVKLWK